MADDFDAAGISWWSTARTAPSSTSSFGGSSTIASSASASCSAAIADPGTTVDQLQSAADPLIYGTDWNQSLLRNSDSTTRFHSMLQENFNYLSIDSGPHHHMGSEQFTVDHHQQVLQQQQQQQPALSMMLQELFEPPQPIFGYQNPSTPMSSHFLTPPPTKQQQLQFSNSPTAASVARSELYPSAPPVQFSTATAQSYEHNPSCSSVSTSKWSSDKLLLRKKKSTGGDSESATKKSRINAPSTLPTFKVRKEKLGDRITALQQLVSPFGKTDTASVLHEAIEYIKFLHDQVSLLTAPYLKNGDPMQHQQESANRCEDGEGQDLRSRGLCLVPIETTYPVTRETTADFWSPSFGGNFR